MKKGVDAKIIVYISGQPVEMTGMATWTYSGESLDLLEEVTFANNRHDYEVGLEDGGEIECSGFYRLDSDAAQQQIDSWFAARTKLVADDFKLYIDDTHFITPALVDVPTVGDAASYAVITKNKDIGQDASGTGTFAFSMKVTGFMKESTD